jgi:hypothetical protein
MASKHFTATNLSDIAAALVDAQGYGYRLLEWEVVIDGGRVYLWVKAQKGTAPISTLCELLS